MRALARWSVLAMLASVFAFPLYWAATMAFKPPAEWNPPGKVYWAPQQPTLSNFTTVLGLHRREQSPFLQPPSRSALRPIANSLVAAGGGSAIALVAGALAAYGMTRFRAGGRIFRLLLLQARIFPVLVLAIPLLFIAGEIGLQGTLWGLALVYGAITLPIATWLVRGFLIGVPRELEEAAIVDGCSYWGALRQVVLPQLTGALLATALIVFILNWSDFALASVLTDADSQTATVFLQRLQSDELERQYGPQAALALILMLPTLALGLLARGAILRGLTLGALGR